MEWKLFDLCIEDVRAPHHSFDSILKWKYSNFWWPWFSLTGTLSGKRRFWFALKDWFFSMALSQSFGTFYEKSCFRFGHWWIVSLRKIGIDSGRFQMYLRSVFCLQTRIKTWRWPLSYRFFVVMLFGFFSSQGSNSLAVLVEGRNFYALNCYDL